jgi:hypothetical protein
MKKIVLLLSVVALAFTSCSKSEEAQVEVMPVNNIPAALLLKKIVCDDGEITSYEYDGNKLKKIIYENPNVSPNNYQIYTYTGDLITNIKMYNLSTNSLMYEYGLAYNINNNLISATCVYGNSGSRNYTYNTDGTVSYTNTSQGLIKFSNEDIIEDNGYLSGTNPAYTYNFIYTYDNKNSIAENIIGIDKIRIFASGKDYSYSSSMLFNYGSSIIGSHNMISRKVTGSSSSLDTYTYTYNIDGYPSTSARVRSGFTGVKNYTFTYY